MICIGGVCVTMLEDLCIIPGKMLTVQKLSKSLSVFDPVLCNANASHSLSWWSILPVRLQCSLALAYLLCADVLAEIAMLIKCKVSMGGAAVPFKWMAPNLV